MRTETNFCIFTKQFFRKYFQSTFQVAHCYAFIDYHAFQLVEYRGMCCVNFVRTIYSTGTYHTDRQFAFFHCTNLYGGCLCSQQDIAVDVECILFVFCRMVCRDIQCFEVVVVFFDFGTVYYFITHAHEDIIDFVDNDAHRVFVTFGSFFTGHCYVDFFICQTSFHFCCFQSFFAFIQHFFDFSSYFICQLTDNGSFFSRQFTHFFQNGCQFTFFAEEFYFQLVNVFDFFGFLECCQCLFLDQFQLILHCFFSSHI